MEIPWKLMGWSALFTLILLIAIYAVYLLSKFIFKRQNLKLPTDKKFSKKQMKFGITLCTILSAIIFSIAGGKLAYDAYLGYSVVLDKRIFTGDRLLVTGEKVGEYRFLVISKEEFKSIPKSDITNFLNVDVRKQDFEKYDYFHILFEDGTGINIIDPDHPIWLYGTIDKTSTIYPIGNILFNLQGDWLYIKDGEKIPDNFL